MVLISRRFIRSFFRCKDCRAAKKARNNSANTGGSVKGGKSGAKGKGKGNKGKGKGK